MHREESLEQAKRDSIEVEDKIAITISRHAWLTLAILSSTLVNYAGNATKAEEVVAEIRAGGGKAIAASYRPRPGLVTMPIRSI